MKKLIYLCGLLGMVLAACLQDIDPLNYAPEVNTGEATDITYTSATLSGTIRQNINSVVQSGGILVAENESMEAATEIHAPSGNYASFTLAADNLEPGRTYYYCAYANSGYSVVRGDVESFTTRASQPPVMEGMEIVSHDEKSLIVRATVTDEGGSALGLCGFRYMEATDNDEDLYLQGSLTTASVVDGLLADTITSLKPSTEYVVCAYASNGTGAGYSDILHVMTDEATVPVVSAITPLDSTVVSVLVQASVVDAGKSALTDIGFCWSTETAQPTTSHFSQSVKDQLGNESFSWDIGNLNADATYYIRAYAVNSQGTGYGDTKVFATTSSAPVVGEVTVTDVQFTSVIAGAKIVSHGGLDIMQKGFYYSASNENPGIGDTQVIATNVETDSITATIEGLASHTTYYIRAYATNNKGTSVGEVTTFTTADNRTVPEVETTEVANIGSLTATFRGAITADGNTPVTERGFVWGTDSDPVAHGGTWQAVDTEENTFTFDVTGLRSSTTYYVCAYAANEIGMSYGEVLSFVTQDRVPGIYNADELVAFRDAKNNGEDISAFINSENVINLFADIDMSSIGSWTPINQIDVDEVFDGNGYTISNVRMSYDGVHKMSFIGENNGVVRNLTLTGSFEAPENVATFVPIGVFCGINNGTLQSLQNYVNVTGLGPDNHCYGMATDNYGRIEDCSNHGTINGYIAGGITGTGGAGGEIIRCANYGTINARGGGGGIVGGINHGTISECINEGPVSVQFNGGGISARIQGGRIDNCRNRNTVTGGSNVGGIVGSVEPRVDDVIEIINNTHEGAVEGSGSSVGGICGIIEDGLLNYSNNTNIGTVNGEPGTTENEIGSDNRQ